MNTATRVSGLRLLVSGSGGATCQVAALLVLLVLAPGFVHAGQAELSVGLGQPVLPADRKNVTYLKVGLTGFPMPRAEERAPVNVALVLDKSGSMAGEKISKLREAALAAIDRLNSDDIVSIVVFDHTVQVLVPATKLTDRVSARRAIERIEAGGNTALFAGVSKGAEELRKFLDRGRANRIILLSDGQANVGPSSTADLGSLGSSLRREGITVSTLGLGMDYNEDLMAELARRSDGNHYFIREAVGQGRIFDAEFNDVIAAVAQEISVKIRCADGIRPVRLLGRDGEISGQNVYVLINQLCSKQEKYVMLEVEVPPTEAGRSREVAKVEVSYANMATHRTDHLSDSVSATFTARLAEVEAKEDRRVMVSAISQVGNYRNKEATWLRDQGRIKEARDILLKNYDYVKIHAEKYQDKELEHQAEINGRDANNLDDKNWEWVRRRMRSNQSIYDEGNMWVPAE